MATLTTTVSMGKQPKAAVIKKNQVQDAAHLKWEAYAKMSMHANCYFYACVYVVYVYDSLCMWRPEDHPRNAIHLIGDKISHWPGAHQLWKQVVSDSELLPYLPPGLELQAHGQAEEFGMGSGAWTQLHIFLRKELYWESHPSPPILFKIHI